MISESALPKRIPGEALKIEEEAAKDIVVIVVTGVDDIQEQLQETLEADNESV